MDDRKAYISHLDYPSTVVTLKKGVMILGLVLVSAFICSIFCGVAFATGSPEGWSEDICVTTDSAWSYYPVIAVDTNNNVHITWWDYRDGNWEIYYTKLDNNGNTLVDDTRVTTDPGSSMSQAIAVDKNNNVHITWSDFRDGDREIYYTKLDNNGNTLVDDTRLTTDSAWSSSPAIAVDTNNNVHITWFDERDGNPEIYYMKLDNNGNTLVDDTRLTNSADSWTPAIAVDTNNNVHITWQEDRDGNREIYYTKLSNTGNTLVDDTRLTTAFASSWYPAIAVDMNNNVHITWCDKKDGNPEIYYTKLDNNGNTLVDDTSLTNSVNSWNPVIAVDMNNNVHITWCDERDGNYEIYYTKLDNTGTTLVDDTRLTTDSGGSYEPVIAVDTNNNVHITWWDYRDGNSEIYYKSNCGGAPPTTNPDLTLLPADITFSNPDPTQDEDILVHATIHNIGDVDAYDVVTLFIDGDSIGGIEVGSATIPHLPAGGSTNIEMSWDLSCSSTYITILIDPDNLINETNETNNNCSALSPVGEMQRTLEKLNGGGIYHFYEEFYDYNNDNVDPDDIKESLCDLENEDIWICYLFPYGLWFMHGDQLTCGIDANLWYSGKDPNGEERLDLMVDLADFIPSELHEPLQYVECTVEGNGMPAFSPIYYDWYDTRSEILVKPEISAYTPGLTNMYASGSLNIYYIKNNDEIDWERDFNQINAGVSLDLFEFTKNLNRSFWIFDLEFDNPLAKAPTVSLL
jgi:hypothetical protein